jgi:esterase FrsA
MSYQWPLDPQHLFGERYAQMVSTGLPVVDVDGVRDAVTDMWADSAGGWVYEWSKLAESYADAGSHQQAALAYGWAKFPTLADEHKRVAQAHQLEQYVLASPGFGVDFQREVLELPYQGGTTPVPVHLLAPSDLPADAPVVLACGGTDLWKMDMHIGWVVLAMQLRGAGAGLRHPRHRGIVGADDESRRRGDRARPHRPRPNPRQRRSGLRGRLHGRALRGSLRTGRRGRRRRRLRWAGRSFLRRGPSAFGMPGIIGNTLGFDAPPSAEELSARLAEFSLRPLLVVGHSLGGHDHRYRVAASAVVAQLIYCWRGRAWARSEWVNGPKWRRLALY